MPATQTVEFFAAPSQTVTAKLFAAGSDTVVASVTATEQSNRKGVYRAVYTDVAAGLYRLLALVSTTPIASWWTDLTLTTATFQSYEIPTSVFAGGGGGTDWTANERTAIRSILGIPTSGTTPTDPTVGILDTIRDKTTNLPIDPANASDIDANFSMLIVQVNTLTSYVDTEVAAIKAKTDNLPVDPADASDIAASFSSLTGLVNTLTGYVDTEVAAIKAKTDNLPVDPADASDIAASFATVNNTLATIAAYIDTEVAAIKAKTDNLPASPAAVSNIPTASAIATAVAATQALTRLDSMIESDGAGQFRFDTIALSMGAIYGGSGARTVAITVRDSSANPIQNATVRISRTGEAYVLQTNASGLATFSIDDATWTVAITATNFSFSPVSLVVSGNVTQTYTMTAAGNGVTPSNPPFCTGYFTVYNQNGIIQAGAQVSLQASAPPVGSTGIVMEDAVRTATADNNGVVQFSNMIKGATYIVYRTGSSRKFSVLVPVNAGNTQALTSIVG
jgi:hypothetical protein